MADTLQEWSMLYDIYTRSVKDANITGTDSSFYWSFTDHYELFFF